MRRVLAALALAAAGVAVAGAADDRPLGACYCRATGETVCAPNVTEAECKRRCDERLADDWTWLEGRVCWNWGYGG